MVVSIIYEASGGIEGTNVGTWTKFLGKGHAGHVVDMEVEAKLTLCALCACRHDVRSVGCSPKRDALEALVHTWAMPVSALSFLGRRTLEPSELEPRGCPKWLVRVHPLPING